VRIKFSLESLKERLHSEVPSIDRTIILKWVFGMWIEFIWFRIGGTGGGLL
jgi:hypothetical protein